MIDVKVTVNGCMLDIEQPILAGGTVGKVCVAFDFVGDEWMGLAKTAVFHVGTADILMPLEQNKCELPAEALAKSGSVKVGVFGTDGVHTLTTVFKNLRIDCGVPTDGESAANFTPGLYEQFAARFARFEKMSVSATAGKNAEASFIENGDSIKLCLVLPKGSDGYTPVRGEDYWTEEDKAEIKSYVEDAILGGAW